MALKNQGLTVTYTAINTTSGAQVTGDVGNHTLRVITDGSSAAPANAATEIDATNAPGEYKITLTAAEMNGDFVTLAGVSSSANVVIVPIKIATERGVLPTVAAGAAGGFVTGDGSVTFTAGVGNRPAVDAVAISADTTAADNLEAMLDGTGGVTLTADIDGAVSGAVGSISAITFPTNFASLSIDASGRVDVIKWASTTIAVGTVSGLPTVDLEAINNDAAKAGYLDTMIGNGILTATFTGNLTGSVASVVGAVGSVTGAVASVTAGVTLANNAMSAAASAADFLAEINTQVDTAIVTYGLDHLVSTSVAGTDIANDSIVASLVSKSATADWDDFNNTTDSLQAIVDTGLTVSGTVNADVVKISGDSTAADNLELFMDGTGYAGGTIKLGVDVVKISDDATAANNLELMYDGTGYAGGTIKLTVDAVKISGDGTAADNLEAMLDGTGGVTLTTAIVGNITGNITGSLTGSVGSISGITFPSNFADLSITSSSGRVDVASWVGTAVAIGGSSGLPNVNIEAINDDSTKATYLDTMIGNGVFTADITGDLSGSVGSVTGAVGSVTGAVGSVTAGVSLAANAMSAAASAADFLAEINTQVDTALSDIGLDHLVSASVTGTDVADNSIIAQFASKSATADWDSYDNTTDSFEALQSVGVTVSGTISADVVSISGDSTAADNWEAMLDGTGGVTLTANVTGDITGSLSGSVGSVTGAVGSISAITFPTNFASLSINASGRVDVASFIGTAATLSVGGLLAVDAQTISNSGTAADNVESLIANLDATISSRAAASTALSTSTWTAARAGYLDELNIGAEAIAHTGNAASFMADVSALATSAALAVIDGNVDTLITNVPDVISLAAINAQVDTALTDYDAVVPADLPTNFGSLDIDVSGYVLIQGTINDLDTLNDPTAAAIADAVWDETSGDHIAAGSTGLQLSLIASGGGTATLANQTKILGLVQGRLH